MKAVIALTTVALASMATIAVAAPQGHCPPHGSRLERLKAADTNADGALSREEAAALPRLAKHFDQVDSDKNGLVTFEELRAARAAGKHRHGMMLRRLDANGDGQVTRAEALAAAEKHFDRVDANKDGVITAQEADAARAAFHAHAAK